MQLNSDYYEMVIILIKLRIKISMFLRRYRDILVGTSISSMYLPTWFYLQLFLYKYMRDLGWSALTALVGAADVTVLYVIGYIASSAHM